MKVELSPCACTCGATSDDYVEILYNEDSGYFVYCHNCEMKGPNGADVLDALFTWATKIGEQCN